ncbi:MAG: hypothetical protein IKR19_07050, partial [Acholeplasmatales bacterium]|nr:hypothetical protein [Acholeplasmatales bacterium]
RIYEFMDIQKKPKSLDQEVGDDEESSFGDFIPDKDNPNPYQYTFSNIRIKEIKKALSILTDKERDIMYKRFGFNGAEPMTLEDIGVCYGVTREAIRQQITRILRRLKSSEYGKVLEELWEELDSEEN